MANLSHALKEWAIAVDALETGRTIVLLRKGGIREQRRFSVEQTQVLLYPTYEHQQPHLLKDDLQAKVKAVPSGWHPETVQISSVAAITEIFQVSEAAVLDSLLPFHIWNAQFAAERFQWKPKLPLYILLLRVSNLSQTHVISYQSEYGGCRSWIDLKEAIALEGATPVLSDTAYSDQVEKICSLLTNP
ncbi:DUF1802 domain-containing protein [Phormidesmis priestleyi ULC007]|uniref:DUF1802 domain-containing protein n=1 Tax=Phormidesmis priestleyi ULC007 TaxID=1920490 RepID=A0A2T1D3P7_9CYAN|nr:DUF1802 family protein [Phormidesmis priestleyi]PSB15142.1 DUF1802 domain-containing protein [Phormidesmis priestleyi ULC007]PZO45908.1 MAG: DUF1802 domain-containing protein [Phormidesmis priestleyi]